MDIIDLMSKTIKNLHETVRYIGPKEFTIGTYEGILGVCLKNEIDLPLSPEEISGLQNYYILRFHDKEGNAKEMYNLLNDLLLRKTDMDCSMAFYRIKMPESSHEKIAKKIEEICERREAKPSKKAVNQWHNYARASGLPDVYDLLLRVCYKLGLEVWLGEKEREMIFKYYKTIGNKSGMEILRKMEEARKERISNLEFDFGNLGEISDLLGTELKLDEEGAKEAARKLLEEGNFDAAGQLAQQAGLSYSEIFRELHPLYDCPVSKQTFLEEDVTDETSLFLPRRCDQF